MTSRIEAMAAQEIVNKGTSPQALDAAIFGARVMAAAILKELEAEVESLRGCAYMNSDNDYWIKGMDHLLNHLRSLFEEPSKDLTTLKGDE